MGVNDLCEPRCNPIDEREIARASSKRFASGPVQAWPKRGHQAKDEIWQDSRSKPWRWMGGCSATSPAF